MACGRTPKYTFGLLESPNSSYFSSSGNELSTTLASNKSERQFQSRAPATGGVRGAVKRDHRQALGQDQAESSPEAVNISHLSSIAGEQRGCATEKSLNTDTLLASGEESFNYAHNRATTPRSIASPLAGSSSSHVFQLPKAPVPRKTPKSTTRSNTTTPHAFNLSASGGSRTDTSATPRYSKKTPRSTRSDITDTPRLVESSNIVSIVEGRGLAKGEIGMASIDLRHPVIQISQFADSQTYVKTISRLQILSPIEIIFPNTMHDAMNMVKLFRVVSDNFQNANITTVQRHYFNETKGMEYIRNLGVKEHSSVEMDAQKKYYCLAATAALVKYVEFIENTIFANHSLKIVFKGSDQTTLIDAGTAGILELAVNAQDPKSTESLYGLLNHTQTPGGARWLRSNILQPPNDLETIILRQDCIQELTNDKEFFFGLKACLGRFDVDLDSLLTSVVTIPKQETEKIVENKIAACILLKHILQLIPALEDILSSGKSELFVAYCNALKDSRFDDMLNKLLEVIHHGAQYQKGHLNMRNQKCFAVKSGINGILDAARRTYSELIEDTNEVVTQLAEIHNLPIKCAYNASRGFYIQMSNLDKSGKQPELPPIFLKVTKNKSNISCTTDDLICMNEKINQAVKSIYGMANQVVSDLLIEVRGVIGCLYNLSETISMLDVLVSFAHVATTSEYVRPEFTDTLAVKQGRHPILEKIKRGSKSVPNDFYVADEANFLVITGPNMSGKSTFLKQVALMQIMAQIGSFVPADYASFRLADQIFSRVGSDDDIETNSSTFTVEMKEINYILQNVTDNSLVIIDELGRGTASEEGVGICWAISEFLLSQKAFTFFATHFLELCRLESLYPNVENLHFKIDHVTTVSGSLYKILYTYLLMRGHCDEKHYGLKLAEFSTLPKSVIRKAWEIAKSLEKENEEVDLRVAMQNKKDKATFRLAHRLLQMSRSCVLEGEALKNFLVNLRNDYMEEISDCDQDVNERTTAVGEHQNPDKNTFEAEHNDTTNGDNYVQNRKSSTPPVLRQEVAAMVHAECSETD